MKVLKELIEQSGELPELRLFVRDENGVPQPTGPHRVKLLDTTRIVKATSPRGKERYEVELHIEEEGVEKTYNFPVKAEDKDGNPTGSLHYLVKRLAEFEYGQEVVLEGKKERGASFVEVKPAPKYGDDIPVVD